MVGEAFHNALLDGIPQGPLRRCDAGDLRDGLI
jgi:hypothetical protein